MFLEKYIVPGICFLSKKNKNKSSIEVNFLLRFFIGYGI